MSTLNKLEAHFDALCSQLYTQSECVLHYPTLVYACYAQTWDLR